MNPAWYMAIAVLMLAGAATVLADDRSQDGSEATAENRVAIIKLRDGTTSRIEMPPLKKSGSRLNSTRSSAMQKATSGTTSSSAVMNDVNGEFWFYDAFVDLYSDLDYDGYYTGVDIAFDVDTIYDYADVYAVIYLSYDYGPWNEFVATDDFEIFGATGDDEYFIDTELVSGYPTGDYDVLIELYDNYDGSFVATFGPDDSSALSYLPLEDEARDIPTSTTVVVVEEHGGGAVSWFGLLVLFGFAGLVRARRA